MKKIKAEKLSREGFAAFGSYYCMTEPDGHALYGTLHQFFPDRLTGASFGQIGFSPITVKKPKVMLVDEMEYHTTTWEMILPMNDDMIIQVTPASGRKPALKLTRVFLVPKGTLVKLSAAVWHLVPLPVHEPELQAMIILPECTYMNDCNVIQLNEEERFEIIL